GAEALEDDTGGNNRILRWSKPDPKRESGLVARLRGLEERIECPVISVRRGAGRIHGLNVDAGVLLHQVDARARSLDLVADRRRHRNTTVLSSTEIGHDVVLRTILLNQLDHDVVDRLKAARVSVWQPTRHVQDVVARPGLRLGGEGYQRLVASKTVDLDLDLFLRRPLLDQCVGRLVGVRYKMVPKPYRELAGRMRDLDERSCNHCR